MCECLRMVRSEDLTWSNGVRSDSSDGRRWGEQTAEPAFLRRKHTASPTAAHSYPALLMPLEHPTHVRAWFMWWIVKWQIRWHKRDTNTMRPDEDKSPSATSAQISPAVLDTKEQMIIQCQSLAYSTLILWLHRSVCWNTFQVWCVCGLVFISCQRPNVSTRLVLKTSSFIKVNQ